MKFKDVIDNIKYKKSDLEVYKFFPAFNKPIHDLNYIPLYNHGYYDKYEYNSNDDKLDRYCLNLYAQLFFNFELIYKKNIKTEGKVLLDIGCGLGRGAHFLKNHLNFNLVYAVDLYSRHIKVAKEKFKDVEYINLDAKQIQLLDINPDVVTCVESVIYYGTKHFFKEIFKKLNNDGVVLITSPFKNNELLKILNNCSDFFDIKIFDITEKVKAGSFEHYNMLNSIQKHYNLNENEFILYKDTYFKIYSYYDKNQNMHEYEKKSYLNLYLTKKHNV